MAQTKVKLVSNGVITVDNLHTNHGITTDHVGEGSVLYYTDARVQNYLTTNNYATEAYVSTTTTNSANWDTAYSWGDHSLAGYLTSFTETDPIYTASSWYTTTNNAANWDTAFGWGNHASAGYLTSFTESDPVFTASAASGITSTNISNWNTAYGWGNHASQGYATQTYVNTAVAGLVDAAPATLDTLNELAAALGDDPNFATTVSTSIGTKWTQDNTKISNWDTAFSWGNHASAGYQPASTAITTSNIGSQSVSFATTSGTFSTDRTNYRGVTDNAVIGQMMWKNYGNSHTIFDASNGTSPSGTSVNNTNPDVAWTGTYPTLMGWNGSGTYGVRVDSSRYADNAATANGANGNFYVDDNYGNTIIGLYDSTKYQGVFAMGNAYKLPADGTTTGNLYGLAWSHPNAGGVAGNLNDHGLLVINNGVFASAISSSIRAASDIRAPIFYDSNNTAHYVDPSGGSNIRNLYVGDAGDSWSDPGGWGTQVRFSNAPHVKFVLHARTPGIEAGMYVHTPGSVYMGSYTSHVLSLMYAGVVKMQVEGGRVYSHVYTEAAGSSRAPIFYDSNDTAYYVDPNGTSKLNNVDTNDGNIELYKSQTIDMSGAEYSTSNYYPVMIGLPTSGAWIQIQNNLNSNVPSWSSHPAGFTLNLRWWTNGNGWGTTEVNRRVTQYHERFTNSRICGGITQMGTSSQEVVYLRGGGVYYFKYSRNISGFASSTNYTNPYGTESANVTSSPINDVWNSKTGGQQVWADYVRATTDLQTPVLYDYNNTGYYFDGSSTGDSIRVAGDIVAYYSDERLKDIEGNIPDALNKVKSLNGFYYTPNEKAQKLGYKKKKEVGLSAQEVESILPELIKEAPISPEYKTVDYAKLVPLLIEAIKEQQQQIDELKSLLNK